MTIDELVELCNPLDASIPDREFILGDLVQDSREIKENSVFIAIRGTEVDGHMFLEDAIDQGATVVICEESYYTDKDVCVIEVESTRAIFGKLAQAFAGNPADKLKIVGVTGTNGKTTVATLVYKILCFNSKKASLLGTVANYIQDEIFDSKLTTADPLELAENMQKMIDAGSEYLVMEVSSHALDQGRVNGFDYRVAAFTNLSHDHLDYHTNIEAYAKAKKILFDGLKGDAVAVINTDDMYGTYMVENSMASVYDFGFTSDTLYKCHLVSNDPDGLMINVEDIAITSPLVGQFNAYNLASAYLICKALDLSDEEITSALSTVQGAPGRMESVKVEGAPYVIVDYAHSPDALKNVLETLKDLKADHQKLWVLFGCGGNRDVAKRPAMAKIAEELADYTVVTSDNPRFENPDVIIADIVNGFDHLERVTSITDRREAIFHAVYQASSSDIILVAGKGHEDYQEVEGTRHPFDDTKVSREALMQKTGGAG